MKFIACLAWFASALAFALGQENKKSNTSIPPLSSADLTAIRNEHEAYRRNMIDGAWSKWGKHFTADAIMMPPNNPAVVGPASIEAWGRSLPRITAFQNPIAELEGAGNLAIMRGNFTLTFSTSGQSSDQSDVGKFMVTWLRQPDGAWRFHRGIFNSDLPSPPAAYSAGKLPSSQASADPWLGVWVLNVAKTRINPGPKPKSQTRTYTASPNGEHATYDHVDADGKANFSSSTYQFDGQDTKITGDPHADTMALTRASPKSITAVVKKDGKVVRTSMREVSTDGKTLTVQFKGTNVRGQPIIEEVWVFDRHAAAQ